MYVFVDKEKGFKTFDDAFTFAAEAQKLPCFEPGIDRLAFVEEDDKTISVTHEIRMSFASSKFLDILAEMNEPSST